MSGIIENLGNAVTSMFRGKAPQAQPQSHKVHTVPWGLEAFPEDGEGRTLHIKTGDTLHFVPIDDELHNVAEANIVDDDWLPSRDRQLGINYRTHRDFNEHLKINKPGTYYLVCPIDGHHEVMRLTVVAEGSQKQLTQQNKAQLDKTKQQANQAVKEARQREDEARQAMAQAKQQQTEAAQQRAQQAVQRAQQARQKAQSALQNLENLAGDLGQNATEVVNSVISDVQQGVGNITNQAMNIVSSLTNPLRQLGPLGNHIIDDVNILRGTGTFGSGFPNFDLGQFNIMDQNRVVGPLGPVVKKNNQPRAQNGTVPDAVMVDDLDEELVTFGPAYDERRRRERNHNRVVVRWDSDALLDSDGSVRTLEVPEGTNVVFHSTDGRPHNLVETGTEKKQKLVAETSTSLDHTVRMTKAGTYYFVSTTDPESMRLIVKVHPRDDAADEIINGV